MLRGLRTAFGFLTVLPVGRGPHGALEDATPWFPFVGACIGALLLVLDSGLGWLPDGIAAAIVLASWLGLTGLLHLDGLVDCADALLAPVDAERRLEILRDVHSGAFALGVAPVFLLLKWQGLLHTEGWTAFVVIPAVARGVVVWNLGRWPAARPGGLGQQAARKVAWPGIAFAAVLGLLAPAAALGCLAVGLVATRWAASKLGGGLTGDVHGAVVELAELGGLLAAVAWPLVVGAT